MTASVKCAFLHLLVAMAVYVDAQDDAHASLWAKTLSGADKAYWDAIKASCGPNEEFTDCGTFYPPRCNEDPVKYTDFMCTAQCQCRTGFLLNKAGKCVLPNNC